MPSILPISAVVPTRNRRDPLERMLRSLSRQSSQPLELILVDASEDGGTEELCAAGVPGLKTTIIYQRALVAGAIEQRNQAMAHVSQDAVFFFDDDIIFEPECVARLWKVLNSDATLGGVNALITNQRYLPPGPVSRTLFRLLYGGSQESYAGKCIGPAFNLLPEDRDDLPEVAEVEWLNTTCTLYRRAALPKPPFIVHRVGELRIPAFPQEDLALSLRVHNKWKLANARTARILHDSQPGSHKANIANASKIELVNRHYLMTRLLKRRHLSDYLKLALVEAFGIVTSTITLKALKVFPSVLYGKLAALPVIISARYPTEEEPISTVKDSVVQPKVLIGITTRNRAAILPKAIESALAQDYPHKEIAVFDDASTDETAELQTRFPQVRWLRAEERQGYLPARNQLMRETDADFYFSLDDDAWFMKGDEVSLGLQLLTERPEVGAVAYDILSPDCPEENQRAAPYKTHMYIGCGHLLRLSAARKVGYYTPSPGSYGSEEKDLCVRLLDRGYEIMCLPGVHVWHDKTVLERDLPAQHRSGVCNDFVFAFRRCPSPMILWLMPGKMLSHIRFAIRHGLVHSCLQGMFLFFRSIGEIAPTRKPVSSPAFREFLRRSRAST